MIEKILDEFDQTSHDYEDLDEGEGNHDLDRETVEQIGLFAALLPPTLMIYIIGSSYLFYTGSLLVRGVIIGHIGTILFVIVVPITTDKLVNSDD